MLRHTVRRCTLLSARALTSRWPRSFASQPSDYDVFDPVPVQIPDVPTQYAQRTVELSNGLEMPMMGFGTWNHHDPEELHQCVLMALDEGAPLIDTAARYKNEHIIGGALTEAIDNNMIKRDDIWVTSKLDNTHHAAKDVVEGCEESLRQLGLSYLDLYLIHFPVSHPHPSHPAVRDHDPSSPLRTPMARIPLHETWRALEGLVQKGMVRTIGVSNCAGALLHDLLCYARIPPAVNQIERHPHLTQSLLLRYCFSRNVQVTAYSSLGTPGFAKGEPLPPKHLLSNEVVKEIAESVSRSPAQVLLRWSIQCQCAVIPKSSSRERMRQNMDVWDFALSDDQMARLNKIDEHFRFLAPRHLEVGHGVPLYW